MDVQNKNSECKKPGIGRVIGGTVAGYCAMGIPVIPHKILSPKLTDKMADINEGLSNDEFTKLQSGIAEAFKKSGLPEKGVGILRANLENSQEVEDAMKSQLDKGIVKFLPKKLKEIVIDNMGSTIEMGENACYIDTAKKIVIPEKDLNLAFFHEAGHALNANSSIFGKALQNARCLGLLMVPIMLIALFKNKKSPDEKPKNGFDKAGDFIKNNAGKLTFLAYTPLLLEEGLATLKGNKMAKEVLSADLAQKVAKTNACGFATYALLAAGVSIGVVLARTVRDKIVHKNNKTDTEKGVQTAVNKDSDKI